MATTFQLGVNSSNAIQIFPSYDYSPGGSKIEDKIRTKSGKLYKYKWGYFERFSFTANYVQTSDAAIINSWHNTNTELLWFITSGGVTEVHSVTISGDDTPLREFNQPYDIYQKGKLTLESY